MWVGMANYCVLSFVAAASQRSRFVLFVHVFPFLWTEIIR